MRKLPETIRGISFDFGNTVYPFRASELEESLRALHVFLQEQLGRDVPYEPVSKLFQEIRDRQFTENRPTLKENDFTYRIRLVVRGAMEGEEPATELVHAAEEAYAEGFIRSCRAPNGLRETIAALSKRFDGHVAICSNFVRTDCITRPLERDGLMPYLKTVVVSCDIGYIKPHPAVFAALAEGLGLDPDQIVHVGDDWDADIVGAVRAGMHSIYTKEWRDVPDRHYGKETTPICEIERLSDLIGI